MAKTVVILGGSFAGLHLAHHFLKQKDPDLHVILVSKNSHFYWNISSVRAIIPGIIDHDQLFQPLDGALSRYPASSYELIVGTADATDFGARTVTVSPADGSGIRTLTYDQLVLATGARAAASPGSAAGAEVPWKAAGTHEEAVALLRDTSARVEAADHIVVAGAGATGVEVAGELGFEFGKAAKPKQIVLLAAGREILGGDSIAGAARSELAKLAVEVKTEAIVDTVRPGADGRTEVVLQNGETITTDLYLPAMGLTPNSEYVDKKYLGERGYVEVDDFFKVKGTDGVWAVGDIVSKPKAGFFITQKQAATVGKNIDSALKGVEPAIVKGLPFDVFVCAVGRGRGAGRLGSVKILSAMVWLAKGRTLGIQRFPGYIDGSVA